MTNKKKRVLLVAHDHGGANLLIPLLSHWFEPDSQIEAFFIGAPRVELEIDRLHPAAQLARWFSQRRHSNGSWFYVEEGIRETLESGKWDLVLTGTSIMSNLEKVFWKLACQLSIPCAAICDMWTEYRQRFMEDRKMIFQGLLMVLDDRMAVEARAALGPEVKIKVVGSPHFARLLASKQAGLEERTKVRFISEPAASIFPDAAINEFRIAEYIIEALGERAKDLIIRPHPLDDSEAWRRFIYAYRSQGIHLDEEPSWACHRSTQMAVGVSSMMLIELALVGVPVASFRIPGSEELYYGLPEKEFNIAVLKSREDLERWLKNPDPPLVSSEFEALHTSAIKNIEDVCLGLIRR
jgi:hypothetical protein